MKRNGRKRNCMYGILLAAAVCLMTSSCAASPESNYEASFIQEKGLFPPFGGRAEEFFPKVSIEESLLNAETPSKADPPSEEEIQALGIPEDMLAYWMVLNNKKPFISTDEDGQEFYWNEYFWFLDWMTVDYNADRFMVIDMDGDGGQEVVLDCSPGTSHVLHYEEGEVYSYQFGFRGMKRIHENGIYEGSGGASNTSYYRLTELNKEGYSEEKLAKFDHYYNYYEVEGKEVTQEELSNYVMSYIESSELADYLEFTEEMLVKSLLGNLEEEKLSIAKRIEQEPICDENNPLEADVPEAYLAVLVGREELICATEEGQKYRIDGNRIRNPKGEENYQILYFSMADMERDGEEEIVLTCAAVSGAYGGKTLILHAAEDCIYGYLYALKEDVDAITEDSMFQTRALSPTGYARITSFEEDGCRIEPVEGYDISKHERIRYYYFSEETIAQWLD